MQYYCHKAAEFQWIYFNKTSVGKVISQFLCPHNCGTLGTFSFKRFWPSDLLTGEGECRGEPYWLQKVEWARSVQNQQHFGLMPCRDVYCFSCRRHFRNRQALSHHTNSFHIKKQQPKVGRTVALRQPPKGVYLMGKRYQIKVPRVVARAYEGMRRCFYTPSLDRAPVIKEELLVIKQSLLIAREVAPLNPKKARFWRMAEAELCVRIYLHRNVNQVCRLQTYAFS